MIEANRDQRGWVTNLTTPGSLALTIRMRKLSNGALSSVAGVTDVGVGGVVEAEGDRVSGRLEGGVIAGPLKGRVEAGPEGAVGVCLTANASNMSTQRR